MQGGKTDNERCLTLSVTDVTTFTWTTGTAARVPGLWSLRCPVIQAFSVFSCRLSGRTCAS